MDKDLTRAENFIKDSLLRKGEIEAPTSIDEHASCRRYQRVIFTHTLHYTYVSVTTAKLENTTCGFALNK